MTEEIKKDNVPKTDNINFVSSSPDSLPIKKAQPPGAVMWVGQYEEPAGRGATPIPTPVKREPATRENIDTGVVEVSTPGGWQQIGGPQVTDQDVQRQRQMEGFGQGTTTSIQQIQQARQSSTFKDNFFKLFGAKKDVRPMTISTIYKPVEPAFTRQPTDTPYTFQVVLHPPKTPTETRIEQEQATERESMAKFMKPFEKVDEKIFTPIIDRMVEVKEKIRPNFLKSDKKELQLNIPKNPFTDFASGISSGVKEVIKRPATTIAGTGAMFIFPSVVIPDMVKAFKKQPAKTTGELVGSSILLGKVGTSGRKLISTRKIDLTPKIDWSKYKFVELEPKYRPPKDIPDILNSIKPTLELYTSSKIKWNPVKRQIISIEQKPTKPTIYDTKVKGSKEYLDSVSNLVQSAKKGRITIADKKPTTDPSLRIDTKKYIKDLIKSKSELTFKSWFPEKKLKVDTTQLWQLRRARDSAFTRITPPRWTGLVSQAKFPKRIRTSIKDVNRLQVGLSLLQGQRKRLTRAALLKGIRQGRLQLPSKRIKLKKDSSIDTKKIKGKPGEPQIRVIGPIDPSIIMKRFKITKLKKKEPFKLDPRTQFEIRPRQRPTTSARTTQQYVQEYISPQAKVLKQSVSKPVLPSVRVPKIDTIPVSKIKTKQLTKIKTKPAKTMKPIVIPQIDLVSKSKLMQRLRPRQKRKVDSRVRPKDKQRIKVGIVPKLTQKPKFKFKIKNILKQKPKVITRLPKQPKPPKPRKTKKPRKVSKKDEDGQKFSRLVRKRVGYNAYIKEKGKFFKINKKPMDRTSASSKVAFILDNTKSSEGKIKKTKQPVQKVRNYMFIPSKFIFSNNKIIEKKQFRKDTRGERKGINWRSLVR
jgi:hypothetical protein